MLRTTYYVSIVQIEELSFYLCTLVYEKKGDFNGKLIMDSDDFGVDSVFEEGNCILLLCYMM